MTGKAFVPVLSAENCTFGVPGTILFRDLCFEARAGEVIAMLGPTGIGKTTLLRTILLMNDIWQGRFQFGQDIGVESRLDGESSHVSVGKTDGRRRSNVLTEEWASDIRRTIGYVPQGSLLFPFLTAEQNVALPLRARGVPSKESMARTTQYLVRLRLNSLAERKPWQLSGGQKQRVAIARAMVAEPPLLLLDEPTASTDPTTTIEIGHVIKEYVKEGVRSAIVVSHDIIWSSTVADKMIFLGGDGAIQKFTTREMDQVTMIQKMKEWFSEPNGVSE